MVVVHFQTYGKLEESAEKNMFLYCAVNNQKIPTIGGAVPVPS
jgi:hypothetical protein